MPSRKSSHRAGLRATRIISAVRPTSFSPRMARCSSPTTGPARSTASATRSKDGAFERLRLLGNEWPQLLLFSNERRNALVVPGLDPGIHQKRCLARQIDCRVKPGNDAGEVMMQMTLTWMLSFAMIISGSLAHAADIAA